MQFIATFNGLPSFSPYRLTFPILTFCYIFVREDLQLFCFCETEYSRTWGWQRASWQAGPQHCSPSCRETQHRMAHRAALPCTACADVTLTDTKQQLHVKHAVRHTGDIWRPPSVFFVPLQIWPLIKYNSCTTLKKLIFYHQKAETKLPPALVRRWMLPNPKPGKYLKILSKERKILKIS